MRGLLFATGLALSACSPQLAGGVATATDGRTRGTVTGSFTLDPLRTSAPIIGARLTSVVDHGFQIRSGALHAGYDIAVAPGRFIVELPGVELGAGQPVGRSYGGIGAYAGVTGSARWRFADNPSRRSEFSLLFFTPELVVVPRAGWWLPPEGVHGGFDVEYGLEFALRLVIGSDLASSPQGRPGNDRQGPTPGQEPAR